MKIKEAIEILKHLRDDLHLKSEEYMECFSMAISALEKQEGKKPTHEATIYRSFTCPYCKNVLDHFEEFIPNVKTRITYRYCHFCGQKLDWSDMKEENENG